MCNCQEVRELRAYVRELEDKLDRAIVPDLSENRVRQMRELWPKLPPAAIKLLLVLYDAKRLMSKVDIEAGVPAKDEFNERSQKIVDVYVCRIRQVLGHDTIRTYWSEGYQLTEVGRKIVTAALA